MVDNIYRIALPTTFSGRSLVASGKGSPHFGRRAVARRWPAARWTTLYWGMKFDAAPTARRRTLEAAQRYRGLTFTDRGEILLDVSNVKNGRVTLSQRGQGLSLLPETISGIQPAGWMAIFLDEVALGFDFLVTIPSGRGPCMCLAEEKIRINDKYSRAEISISKEQIKAIVDCIVEPWLANCSPAHSEDSRIQTHGQSQEIAAPKAQASQVKPGPVADLS
jgi:hypothetical protein